MTIPETLITASPPAAGDEEIESTDTVEGELCQIVRPITATVGDSTIGDPAAGDEHLRVA